MKEQIKAVITRILSASPLNIVGYAILILIAIDIFKGNTGDAATVSIISSYAGKLVSKISGELIGLVAVILALKK